MARQPIAEPLRGTGVGTTTYRGTARVVAASDAGLDRLEPGDILVTPFTTPAYNTVAPLLGGLITEEGGVMSHAAFLARECGIPAVLGVAHATRLIPDGTTITIDPAAQLPRLHRYAQRLADALANVQAGQSGYISSPILDSYHTIWFELHEELITAAGRIRAVEAAAGRAT